jgi:hypothetical protein
MMPHEEDPRIYCTMKYTNLVVRSFRCHRLAASIWDEWAALLLASFAQGAHAESKFSLFLISDFSLANL